MMGMREAARTDFIQEVLLVRGEIFFGLCKVELTPSSIKDFNILHVDTVS